MAISKNNYHRPQYLEEAKYHFRGRQPRNVRPPGRYGKGHLNPLHAENDPSSADRSCFALSSDNHSQTSIVKNSDSVPRQLNATLSKSSSDHSSAKQQKTNSCGKLLESNRESRIQNGVSRYHNMTQKASLKSEDKTFCENLDIRYEKSLGILPNSRKETISKTSLPIKGDITYFYGGRSNMFENNDNLSTKIEQTAITFNSKSTSSQENKIVSPTLSLPEEDFNFKQFSLPRDGSFENNVDKIQYTYPLNDQTFETDMLISDPSRKSFLEADQDSSAERCMVIGPVISQSAHQPMPEVNVDLLNKEKDSMDQKRPLDAANLLKQLCGRKSPDAWFRCPSCNDSITWPHLLNCFHQFCFRCLTKFYTKNEVKCPTCSFLTPVGERGPIDLRLDIWTCQEIIDLDCNPFTCMISREHENACKYCNPCMLFLCYTCIEEHKQYWQTAEHTLTDVPKYYYTEDTLFVMCTIHPNNIMDCFCITCQSAICFACTFYGQTHWRHPLCKDADKARKRKKTLTIEADRMRDHVRRQIQPMILKKQEIENKARACKRNIHLFSNHLIDTVSKKRLEARIHLDKAYDEIAKNVNVFEELTSQFSNDYRSLSEFTDRYLKDPLPSSLLPVSSKIMERFQDIHGKWDQIERLQGFLKVDLTFSPEFPVVNDIITQSYQMNFFESLDNLFNSDTDMGRMLRQNMEEILKKRSCDINSRIIGEFVDRENGRFTNKDEESDSESKFHYSRHGVSSIHNFGDFGKGDYKFGEPSGVTYLLDGSLAVCDTANHRIMIYDEKYIYVRTIGEPTHMANSSEEDKQGRPTPRVSGCLYYPYRLAQCSKTKNIVVVERPPSRAIQIFKENGQFISRFGNDVLQHPRGVAVDENGIIVVVEGRTMKLMLFTQNGSVIQTFHLCVHLEFPNDVAARDSTIYISDNRGHCVHVFDYDGRALRSIGNESVTYYPIGVSINEQNQVVVTDNHNTFNISIFDTDGIYQYGLKSRVKHANCYNVALHPSRLELAVTSRDCQVIIFDYNEPSMQPGPVP